MTYMGSREKALIAKTAFVVFAAVISVPLTFWTEHLLDRYRLPNPGIYVWGLMHPHPEPGFLVGLDSLLGTELVVNASCWFILLCAVEFTIDRAVNKKRRNTKAVPPQIS
jgi:hypothetical protein